MKTENELENMRKEIKKAQKEILDYSKLRLVIIDFMQSWRGVLGQKNEELNLARLYDIQTKVPYKMVLSSERDLLEEALNYLKQEIIDIGFCPICFLPIIKDEAFKVFKCKDERCETLRAFPEMRPPPPKQLGRFQKTCAECRTKEAIEGSILCETCLENWNKKYDGFDMGLSALFG